LTIAGPGVSGSSIVSSSDTQIVANVTVAASSPGGTATIQVQSNGYTGNGFLSASPGQPSQATLNAVIQPIAPPPPQIMFYGTNVAQTTQWVYIGQQIALSVPTTNVPAGLTITSQSWTVPTATPQVMVGGYTASTTSGAIVPLPATNTGTFTFYWVAEGSSQQITYTWSFNNGTSISASVTFNVTGPTAVSVGLSPSTVNIVPPPTSLSAGFPLLIDGNIGVIGMKFLASSNPPNGNQGTYQWVQLLNKDTIFMLAATGSKTCPSVSGGPLLDTTYPYGNGIATVTTTKVTNDTAQDSPANGLPTSWGEVARSFSATMYLMWVPNPDSRCTNGTACTIPATLGTVNWGWTGDAINTLQPQQNAGVSFTRWTLNCSNPSNGGFQTTTSLPQWANVDPGGLGPCH
jgi:hypothetical protein